MTPIQNISIPEACHASWQQMTPVEQGRHCQQCCKTVTDFTVMSNQEIIAYLSTTHDVCGRFDREQLSSLNNRLDIENLQPNSWRRWVMAIGLLSQTMLYKAVAQTKPSQVVIQQTKPVPYDKILLGKVAAPDTSKQVKVSGQITDENHEPLPAVMVKIKGSNRSTVTNADGRFVLNGAKLGDILNISFVGYSSQEIVVNTPIAQTCDIMMRQYLLGDVVVYKRPSFTKRTWNKIKHIF
ncbi:carboxypeptidase-like regulatory domain-containing protein [Mucilaginibacter sp. NFX135]|uniref:carboxypeptidase-like regulatory domain-containing protein n=1 Tax=Mucilaginibacter sp. NFX135 TaxID=3402687 RepID=UPI003AFB07B0